MLNNLSVTKLGCKALENARPRPISPLLTSDMLLAMAEQFNAALKGEIPVGRELENLRGELQSIVEAR